TTVSIFPRTRDDVVFFISWTTSVHFSNLSCERSISRSRSWFAALQMGILPLKRLAVRNGFIPGRQHNSCCRILYPDMGEPCRFRQPFHCGDRPWLHLRSMSFYAFVLSAIRLLSRSAWNTRYFIALAQSVFIALSPRLICEFGGFPWRKASFFQCLF